jgi:glycerol-3-phosphate O-acyltransferase/dihydroxyacetone phosphate acyltransferase
VIIVFIFRWRLTIIYRYGKPINLSSAQLRHFKEDPKAAVKKLTEQMEQILYSLTLNTPDLLTMKLAHTVRRIYMGDTPLSLAEYVEVTRRFAHFYANSQDDPTVKALKEDVQKYQQKLDSLYLKDNHVSFLSINILIQYLHLLFLGTKRLFLV